MYYRRRLPVAALVLLIIFAASILIIDLRLKASILELAQTKAQLRVVELINNAVYDKVVQETEYKDIVYIHKDDQGKIVMLQANTVILNQLMVKTTQAILNSFKSGEAEYIKIPLGQISGITLLSGSGPKIKVRVIPANQIFISVGDKFEQAGINQTRHRIYLQVKTRIKIAVPMMGKDLNVVTTIPMAETIIVGDVPETYVNFTGPADSLYPLIKKSGI